jgi:DNA polymerase III delta prime subunit
LFLFFAVIEKFTENTRFCIICNYLSKIIPALQSRCTRFRFGPLGTEQMVPRLQHVVSEEGYVFQYHYSPRNENLNSLVRINIRSKSKG